MQEMINFADNLISIILSYTLFFLYYGVIFYVIGYAIIRILRVLYLYFSPAWKKLYQAIRSKFQ